MRGGLLLIRGDALVTNPACCCDYYAPSVDCPPCCALIEGGEQVDNTIVFHVGGAPGGKGMTVTVTVPRVDKRLVCQGEQIQIHAELTGAGHPVTTSPSASWDRAWIYRTHSPAIEPDGVFVEAGMIRWGSSTATSIDLTLEYTSCWADQAIQYGDIGIRLGEYSLLITIESCANSVACCEDEVHCEPCCVFVPPGIGENVDGKITLWTQPNANGFAMRVTLVNLDPLLRVVCIGDGLQLDIEIVPPDDYDLTDYKPNPCVGHPGWMYDSATPNPTVLADDHTCWVDMPNLTYSLSLIGPQCNTDGSMSYVGDITVTADPGLSILIPFIACPTVCDNQRCCCPRRCCGPENAECHFPTTQSVCDTNSGDQYEVGGPSQIVNFHGEITHPTIGFPCYDAEGNEIARVNPLVVNQNGQSIHWTICEDLCEKPQGGRCNVSKCTWTIPVIDSCGNEYTIIILYSGTGWNVGAGWGWGNTPGGDCSGHSGTGLVVDPAGNYTSIYSFTCQGAEPC